jgi:hypothetical protein
VDLIGCHIYVNTICLIVVYRFNVQKVLGLILNNANNIGNKVSLVITSNLET